MMAASTYGLFLIFDRVVENFIPAISGWTSIMAALLIAYNLMTRVITPKLNAYFLKYARYELDFEFLSKATISDQGLLFDEGDRQTHIAWSAVGGVFKTRDFLVFYCRGLFYNVPLEDVGDADMQEELLLACKGWCRSARSHKTAKLFT